jgi:hypothetical protein
LAQLLIPNEINPNCIDTGILRSGETKRIGTSKGNSIFFHLQRIDGNLVVFASLRANSGKLSRLLQLLVLSVYSFKLVCDAGNRKCVAACQRSCCRWPRLYFVGQLSIVGGVCLLGIQILYLFTYLFFYTKKKTTKTKTKTKTNNKINGKV